VSEDEEGLYFELYQMFQNVAFYTIDLLQVKVIQQVKVAIPGASARRGASSVAPTSPWGRTRGHSSPAVVSVYGPNNLDNLLHLCHWQGVVTMDMCWVGDIFHRCQQHQH